MPLTETITLTGQRRPKILLVASHWPFARAYGAQQRILNLGRLLGRFGHVSILMVTPEPETKETIAYTESEFDLRGIIRPQQLNARELFPTLLDRIRYVFDPACMVTDTYRVNEHDRAKLQRLMEEHDLTWIHTVRTANWFRIYKWPKTVLDVDDLPSRMLWSRAQLGGVSLRRLLDVKRSWTWRRYERLLQERFSALIVCSEDDKRYLENSQRVHVIPNGSHPLPVQRSPRVEPPRIGCIGNFTFPPNLEGAEWFIRAVWPLVKRDLPRAEFRLIGRGSDDDLAGLGPNVRGLGWVEDPSSEIASWSAMVIPVRMGSGTRVKLADGLARRCPVVTTSMGAFGYDVKNGEDVLLADGAVPFAAACVQLVRNLKFGEALANRAYKRFLERWTWDSFEGTIGTLLQTCLARGKSEGFNESDEGLNEKPCQL